jgi:hypothetical protein
MTTHPARTDGRHRAAVPVTAALTGGGVPTEQTACVAGTPAPPFVVNG